MTTPLTITPSQRPDGTALLILTGEVDMSNSDELARALGGAPAHVVLDFGAVTYLDSAGLAVLFAHADHIELIANPYLRPVFEISRLTDLTAVHGLDG